MKVVEVLEVVTKLLESVGYRIISAHNGLEALEIFNRDPEKIDLIILDVVMPRMGGEGSLRPNHKNPSRNLDPVHHGIRGQ